jgi:hypothetical protein
MTDLLGRLITICHSSVAAYRSAADCAADARCRALFSTIARQRAESAAALAKLRPCRDEPSLNGHEALGMHDARAALPSRLQDIEEEAIVAFSKALDHDLPIEIRAALEEHYRGVKRAYGRLVTLNRLAG